MLPRSFFFVRHGETDWNFQGLLQGWTDIPLNDNGRAQARSAIERLQKQNIDRLVVSPLSRARETAEIINGALRLPLSFCEDLRERGFGALEGLGHETFDTLRKGSLVAEGRVIEETGYACPEGGEPYDIFKTRVLGSFQRALADTPEQNILFVCHGGVYRVLRRCLTEQVDSSPNVQPYFFERQNNSWFVHTL